MPPIVIAGVVITAQVYVSVAIAIISLAMNLIMAALAGKPSAPTFDFPGQNESRTRVVRSATEGARIVYGRAMVSGPLAFVESTGPEKEFAHLVVVLAAHECDAVESVFIGDEEVVMATQVQSDGMVTSGKFAGLVRIKVKPGTDTQGSDTDLASEVAAWTVNHRLRGLCYMYLRLQYDENVFPQGIPNLRAIVRGKKLYDPRTGLTAWSENIALMAWDYLTDQDQGMKIAPEKLPTSWWAAQMNICDEDVELADGSTQKRYHGGGVLDATAKRGDNMQNILTGCAGAVVWSQGNYYLYTGAAMAAVATIDESWLRGDVEVTAKNPFTEAYNYVSGTFVDPARSWEATDFPPVANSLYEEQDGGRRVPRDIDLPFTQDATRAQRLAKIHLEKSRQPLSMQVPCNAKAIRLRAFDNVDVNLAVFGFVGKKFKILNWKLNPDLGVDLVLKEEADADYDWNRGEATTQDPAPNTTLKPSSTVELPGAVSVDEELVLANASTGLQVRVTLEGDPSPDKFVKWYVHEYRAVNDADPDAPWTILGAIPDNRRIIDNFPIGRYDFRVKAINSRYLASEYVTTRKEVRGVGVPPGAPQGMTISAIGGMALLRWDEPTELDVLHGGKIYFRHSPADVGATWATSVSISEPIPARAGQAVLPLKSGTYLAKFRDFAEQFSTDTALATTDGAQVIAFSSLSTITEDPTFGGTHDNTEVSDSKLRLATGDLVDDYPIVDTLANWDQGFTGSGAVSSGEYLFANSFDLTTQTRVRLRSNVTATVVNNATTIDERAANVDDWPDIDDTEGGSADAVVYVRHTNDDPGGTPTWSDWERLESAEYNKRAFQFKIVLSNDGNPDFNIEISELSIDKEEVA